MLETTTGDTITQEIVIPAFDVHHKVFGSGNVEDRITLTVYEIQTSPTHAATLKSILYKASHPDNHSIVQFIPCGIKGVTNKDIYKHIIKKHMHSLKITQSYPFIILKNKTLEHFLN